MKRLALAALLAIPAFAQVQQPWQITYGGYMPWQAPDKRAHFQSGLLGGVVVYTIYEDFLRAKYPMLFTFLTGMAIGLAKEYWDRHHYGTPEFMDAANTAFGFAVGGMPIMVIRW